VAFNFSSLIVGLSYVEVLKSKDWSISNAKFNMAGQVCTRWLEQLVQQLVCLCKTFTLTFCVLNLIFSLVATLGNLLLIRALWKASSIPATVKKLFLSLAFSDLAVGLFALLMYGAIIAVMLQMTATENNNFDILCPTIIIACYFFIFLLVGASFQNIAAIAIDRPLAVSLHLRYQELVTSKRVVIASVVLWLTSGVTAFIFIHLPSNNSMLAATIELVGLLLSAVAYIRIYRVIRYHQNQIHSQLHLPNVRVMVHLREKKSALNALFVYIVFVACYLPHLCSVFLPTNESFEFRFWLLETPHYF